MALPTVRDQLERTRFIEDSDGKVAVRTLAGVGGATLYAVVNTAAAGNVTLNPSPNYIGLVTVSEAVPYSSPSIVIGMVSSASGSLVQFATNAIKWIDVRASYSNPTTCYVGGSNATINNGFPLAPGDTIGMAISNTNQLYLVGVGTTECRFLGGS